MGSALFHKISLFGYPETTNKTTPELLSLNSHLIADCVIIHFQGE
ncbi:hypothetical protein D1AOALGA4SA_2509 [Olavius algarvensis Delta 1 endosymbiont]|nr:hypothetical protein D1AOALGA4SA_2509 [Olavius algarvensis Delta 1 endosymbiont]